MNWNIKIISKTLIIKISHISWGVTTKAFMVKHSQDKELYQVQKLRVTLWACYQIENKQDNIFSKKIKMQKCRILKIIELYMSIQLDHNAFISVSWSWVWLVLSYVSNVSFLVKSLSLVNLHNINLNSIRLRSVSSMSFHILCRICSKFGIK